MALGLKRIFGGANDRKLRRMNKRVRAVNALEDSMRVKSDDDLRGLLDGLRSRVRDDGESLDAVLAESFAITREASRRAMGMRPFDVQILGALALHDGDIAEMKTGEGKTLVATMPAVLNALTGEGVHVVTVNDYLARRDAEWMGKLYRFLGLEVGVIVHDGPDEERRRAYAADITYGANNEFGFDHLRDNMRYALSDLVQRGHAYAIVDEVDSILIDEARTPLIISGPARERGETYATIDAIVPTLPEKSYEVDEKTRTVTLTEEGMETVETTLRGRDLLEDTSGLYAARNTGLVHHVNQALRAHKLFVRDKDYIVRDGEVIIVDEFTGRMMPGRRYSDGLHQALEAKEKVAIQGENMTLASITFQNYFRLYGKLAGMTGTAATEATEFGHVYGLDVVQIPTNAPMVRDDQHDEVYRTEAEKLDALVELLQELQTNGQPVLVGTASVEKSEALSQELAKRELPHNILNARRHEQEAFIVAQAGRPGALTIATNMAGRGTDIQLGGNPEMRILREIPPDLPTAEKAKRAEQIREEHEQERAQALAAGGLFVVGAERHESRRIDNQLRGRAGRQGDPGASRFFLSLEDDLLRIFGSQRLDGMLRMLGLKEGEAIVHPLINRAILKAQQRVEARHFDVRKNLLRYDDVINDQRKAIFARRAEVMRGEDVAGSVAEMREDAIDDLVDAHAPEKSYAEQWDMPGLVEALRETLKIDLPVDAWAAEEGMGPSELRARVGKACEDAMAERVAHFGEPLMRQAEKAVMLHSMDDLWRDHLQYADNLRQVIGWRGYAQRDPLNEYRSEAFSLFEDMLRRLRLAVTGRLLSLDVALRPVEETALPDMRLMHADPTTGMMLDGGSMAASIGGLPTEVRALALDDRDVDPRDPTTWSKTPRNTTCPCGSGRKYKHCHGRLQ